MKSCRGAKKHYQPINFYKLKFKKLCEQLNRKIFIASKNLGLVGSCPSPRSILSLFSYIPWGAEIPGKAFNWAAVRGLPPNCSTDQANAPVKPAL